MTTPTVVLLCLIKDGGCSQSIAVVGHNDDESSFQWVGGTRQEAFDRPAAISTNDSYAALPSPWPETDQIAMVRVPVSSTGPLEPTMQDIIESLEQARPVPATQL